MELRGNLPVIPTPFLQGAVDYASFDRLFERTVAELDGYVVCGSTGESPALTTQERVDIIRYVCRRVPGDKAIVVGLGHTSAADAAVIGKAAADAGARAALVPSPYYFPNSFPMVVDFIGTVAEQTGLDIVFYDNPVTTKTHFTLDQLVELAEAVPQVKGIKMTDHSMEKIRGLKERTALKVFGGDDIICFRAFMAGVDGNMIITPTIYPTEFRACWDAYCCGDVEKSFAIYCDVLLPFISMFGPGDEIPTTKALFAHLHIFASAETRSPILSSDSRRVQEVLLAYRQGLRQADEKAPAKHVVGS